jgi:hypothetical protein
MTGRPALTFKRTGANAQPHRGWSAPRGPALTSLVHMGRFSPVTIGFWLGGVGLGTGGCLLGAWMPYRHPVAVALSVLWWGLYLGCLGAWVGALVGALTGRAPPRPWAKPERTGKVPTEWQPDYPAAHAGSRAVRAARGPQALPGHEQERECPA